MWIVVPAYREVTVVAEVIDEVRAVFPNVVCVDDGSGDGTGDAALRAGAHVITHPVNLGQGAAIQTGVEYARARPAAALFATFDADGQHRVEDLATMVEHLRAANVDLVVGSRFAGGPTQTPRLKRAVLRTAATLSRSNRSFGLTDAHNGLRVFNRRVADDLDLTISGMGHAGEFIALAHEKGWRVTEVPVDIRYTDYSKAKGQPLLNGVNIVFDGLLRRRTTR
ncbi:glycosyltransferase family 2 protein [Mycolicibacterium sp. 018/SC-01/001]|uniref:glycosyltransferase family 2 protein n=1 Tax=Mycolicibacterium sp. 018/SC-01/001 TaxID=2592069 RepID=UPI002107D600|nr:glycosyltransferase family 2 protein [Mycolicibacterium sp. 018/SC-01/001]